MHRIYLAAIMGYGLGSDDPEELAYYKKLRKEMEDMKKDPVKKGNSDYDVNKVKELLNQLDLNSDSISLFSDILCLIAQCFSNSIQ